ncbi:site-2 protease family protein [Salinibacillus kushneri]|nr:M50 family metallopeptidase [Salinibacillus kushneri]
MIFILFIVPLSILLHEFGHAFMAYVFKADFIHFFVGSGKERAYMQVGRMRIHIHTLLFMGGVSVSEKENDFKDREKVLISVAGPLFNGLIAWILFHYSHDSMAVRLSFWFNLWLAILNIFPFRFKKKKSDGYICVEVLMKSFKNWLN